MSLKHADLIRAALDGKTIQFRHRHSKGWGTYTTKESAIYALVSDYDAGWEFRIQPKPDYVKYRVMNSLDVYGNAKPGWFDYDKQQKNPETCPNSIAQQFKITYDGETNKIKKVELVE